MKEKMREGKMEKMPNPSAYLIQIYGGRKVVFEECRRILEYSDESILIEGRQLVRVNGKMLCLKELGSGNLAVVGNLSSLEFCGRKGRR